MNPQVLRIFDPDTDPHQAGRMPFDVVCCGDSLTGWGNYGPTESWPFQCYPEFLQTLCDPLALKVANCGVAGETSNNGVWQVRDYLTLFTTARYFLICYGANDLEGCANHESASTKVIANLGKMVDAVRAEGKQPILLDILDVNGRLFPRDELLAMRVAISYHNPRIKRFCREQKLPLAVISGCLSDGHFGDACHPNSEGAKIIAGIVFAVLGRCVRQGK
jgi:lysophospholipase L1-like esterase